MMSRILLFFKQYRSLFFLPFLSGIFIGTSYIPFPPWALLFCYAPLWLWMLERSEDKSSWKIVFWGAWLTQFTLSMIGFHWIAYTAKEFGGFPWILAIIALLLFASLVHLYIPLVSVLVFLAKQKLQLSKTVSLVVLALSLSLMERVWPSIFPWHLGYPLYWAKLPIYQLAEYIGFNGLSTLMLLSSAFFAYLWLQYKADQNFLKPLFSFLALFVALNFAGSLVVKPWNQTDSKLDVMITQANIGNQEKIYAERGEAYQSEILSRFVRLTNQGLEQGKADLIVWPETAFPDYLDQRYLNDFRQRELVIQVQKWQTPLLLGGYSKDGPEKPVRMVYNSLFLLNAKGDVEDKPYLKTELLAFGEYLPFSEQFPFLLKLLPFIANFGRGTGPKTIAWQQADGRVFRIGGQICYEGLDPAFTIGLAQDGAHLLTNVTNDSWFGVPFETNQHMMMTLARAIEVRRPLIRSTNTGISTVVLANGSIAEKSPTHQEWVGTYEVPFLANPSMTFYSMYGHLDWILISIALLALLGLGLKRKA